MRLQLVWERKEHFYWSINAWLGVKVFPSEDGGGGTALPAWWRGMIKLRSLLHVRGLSGHPTMRECLSPSLGANKLYFGGKYFSWFTGFLGFLDSA